MTRCIKVFSNLYTNPGCISTHTQQQIDPPVQKVCKSLFTKNDFLLDLAILIGVYSKKLFPLKKFMFNIIMQ